MLRVAAHLPDALVLLPPADRRGIGAGDQEPLRVVVDVAELVGEPVRGAEQLAVHVDLLLVPGAVAHPDGTAVPPSVQVRKFPLGQVVLAADAEHDLQARRRGPIPDAAAVAMKAKKSSASSGQAATHNASMVKLASRTHE